MQEFSLSFNYTLFFLTMILLLMFSMSSFLLILIMLEFLLILLLHVSFLKLLSINNDWIFILILIMGVCESVIGISLMIGIVYLEGSEGVQFLNLSW